MHHVMPDLEFMLMLTCDVVVLGFAAWFAILFKKVGMKMIVVYIQILKRLVNDLFTNINPDHRQKLKSSCILITRNAGLGEFLCLPNALSRKHPGLIKGLLMVTC